MSLDSQPPRRKLPQVWRHAMWHSESGLVVSPLNHTLPSAAVSDPHSRRPGDLVKPRLLQDDNIYLAFYPRRPIHRGPLFTVLAISRDELFNSIHVVRNENPRRYVLDPSIQSRWKSLEIPLLEVAQTLYGAHKERHSFPLLSYPRWPHQYGYDVAHSSKEIAYYCAKKSLAAFSMLAAFTTFVLSLWLTEYEDDCFAEAFAFLAERKRDGLPRVWLEYLKDSIVGNLSPGLRPGGFLNPYVTRWGVHLGRFTRASVPFWLLWGKDTLKPANLVVPQIAFYFPPQQYIDIAKSRCLSFSNTILPTQQFEGRGSNFPASRPTVHFPDPSSLPTDESSSNAAFGLEGFVLDNGDAFVNCVNPDEPPPPVSVFDRENCVEASSGQKPGENWEVFLEHQTKRLEWRKQKETAAEKHRRESLENAMEKGPTNKTAVFLWVQDDLVPTFYRRTRLIKHDASTEWDRCTKYQRFFWAHRNEWDLCPHLPAYPPHVATPAPCYDRYDSDDDEPILGAYNSSAKPINEPVGPIMLRAVEQFTERDKEPENSTYSHGFWSPLEYLRCRHGFSAADFPTSWNPTLHTHPKYTLAQTKVDMAIKNIGYIPAPEQLTQLPSTSIVDFHNTAMNTILSYTALPSAWDISRDPQTSSLTCHLQRIDLQRVTGALFDKTELYILRPPRGSRDPSPWFIATTSATAVLMVYRSPWTTMLEIGRGLLDHGVPFHTVVERQRIDVKEVLRSRRTGLGLRPSHFKPERADFATYENARDDVLRSRSGRAIRLLGGIVGRLAAEVVPNYEVLDGPYLTNVKVVGTHGDMEFVDDAVEQHELDIVSGVYDVEGKFKEAHSHMSWWPKHATFLATGYAGDQWLPRAEEWYQKRLDELRSGHFTLQSSTRWEKYHKFNAAQMSQLRKGSERMAAEFISKSRRVY